MGIQISKREGAILRVIRPIKSIVSHCCVVRCKKIINGRHRSATAAADCNAVTGRCHITLSPVKIMPPRWGLSSKILRPLVICRFCMVLLAFSGTASSVDLYDISWTSSITAGMLSNVFREAQQKLVFGSRHGHGEGTKRQRNSIRPDSRNYSHSVISHRRTTNSGRVAPRMTNATVQDCRRRRAEITRVPPSTHD